MNKKQRLIVNAAKAVVDTEVRKLGADSEAKACFNDACLECIRKFYRHELRQWKEKQHEAEEISDMFWTMGCIHECENVTQTILGECTTICEQWEFTQLPHVIAYLTKCGSSFIISFLQIEIGAATALEEYFEGNIDIEAAKGKITEYFLFMKWSQEDFDKQIPELALISGIKITVNENIKIVLKSARDNYLKSLSDNQEGE